MTGKNSPVPQATGRSSPVGITTGTGPLTVVSEEPLNLDSLWDYSLPNTMLLDKDDLNHIDTLLFSAVTNPLTGKLPVYFSALGGYPVTEVNTQIVVQDNGPKPIRILNIYAVKSCGAPLTGTLFFAPGQGGESDIELGFDLDAPISEARISDGLHMVGEVARPIFRRIRLISRQGSNKFFICMRPRQDIAVVFATGSHY